LGIRGSSNLRDREPVSEHDPNPFERIPFDDLPEKPRRDHDYDKTDARHIEVATATFGNVDPHDRVFGEGPPLLLVHGLVTSSYWWRYVFEALGDYFTLYAPDLPGGPARPKRSSTPNTRPGRSPSGSVPSSKSSRSAVVL
jgi:pimeloyl-ACP methyl ester carboxylesterase